MMIIAITGPMGSGKTTAAVMLAYFCHLQFHYQVYANLQLKFPAIYVPNPLVELFRVKNEPSVLLLDEIVTLADSRRSMTHQNQFINLIATTSRKCHVHIIFTAQLATMADVRLRQLTTLWLRAVRLTEHVFCLVDEMNPQRRLFFNAAPIFDLFNTYEIIQQSLVSDEAKQVVTQEYIHKVEACLRKEQSFSSKNAAQLLLIQKGLTNKSLNTLVIQELIDRSEIVIQSKRKTKERTTTTPARTTDE